MSKLQKAKKPKAKQTQRQKQAQNVVVNIHKPTRAKKSQLQKEASPKEKRIPHPPPQFSFNPVISIPAQQNDNSITRHILLNQDKFERELKKYALSNSTADEVDALKREVAHLKLGSSTPSPIVLSDLDTRGTSNRFVGDHLDTIKLPIDSRLSLEGMRQQLQTSELRPISTTRFANTQRAEERASRVSILELAGPSLKAPEEESQSRIGASLAEQAGIQTVERGGGTIAEAESALHLIHEALGGGSGDLPTRQEFKSAMHQTAPSIVETLARVQEGAAAEDLSGESLARSGTQQSATFQLNEGETAKQALVKIATANGIRTTGQYTNTAGKKTFGNLPLEVLLAKVQDRGIEVPEVIAQAKTKGGRKAKGGGLKA